LLPQSATENVVSSLSSDPNFSILVDLVVTADLSSTLTGPGNWTLFAPTNEAFETLGTETLESLGQAENLSLLRNILGYHLTDSVITSDLLTDGQEIAMQDSISRSTFITMTDDSVMINDADIIGVDNLVNNGVVHYISSVL
jgi:uncharacterized surface protein with fasciclin (FAS1) repeats